MKAALFLVAIFGLAISSNQAVDWAVYEAKILKEAQSQQVEPQIPQDESPRAAFNCPADSLVCDTPIPTSVHQLRPCHVKAVGAIGDSLTAANGARAGTIIGLLTEDRDIAWSAGGADTVSRVGTMPNILKQFSPRLYGFSVAPGKATDAGKAKFNLADPGDKAFNMPQQAIDMVNRMKADPSINFQNDWKVVTLFIGGNDLCDYCNDKVFYSPNNYIGYIRSALDYMQANLPRTFVNLVATLNVWEIDILSGTTCRNMQKVFCDCALQPGNKAEINKLAADYVAVTADLVNSGRYDTRDDFTVVLQPFMAKMKPPTLSNGKADFSYFAPDCFHFSTKGHDAAGTELWNAMLTPVGQKTEKWSIGVAPKCPTKDAPFLFTKKNSPSYRLAPRDA